MGSAEETGTGQEREREGGTNCRGPTELCMPKTVSVSIPQLKF